MPAVKASTTIASERAEQPSSVELQGKVLARTIARAFDCVDFASNVRSSTHVAGARIVFCDHKVGQANRQIGRLWTAAKFERGWDGRDAEAPNATAIRAAQDMITRLTYTSVPVPLASVGCEGQSNLFWEADNFYADVDVTDESVSYTIDQSGEDQSFEEPLIDGFIPPRLLQILMSRYER